MSGKNQGKVREFEVDDTWQPCWCLLGEQILSINPVTLRKVKIVYCLSAIGLRVDPN